MCDSPALLGCRLPYNCNCPGTILYDGLPKTSAGQPLPLQLDTVSHHSRIDSRIHPPLTQPPISIRIIIPCRYCTVQIDDTVNQYMYLRLEAFDSREAIVLNFLSYSTKRHRQLPQQHLSVMLSWIESLPGTSKPPPHARAKTRYRVAIAVEVLTTGMQNTL